MEQTKGQLVETWGTALSDSQPSLYFRSLSRDDQLGKHCPDLALGKDCAQNIYHSETVLEHNLRTLDAMAALTGDPYLRLAALMHDVAKPHTREECDGVGYTFHKHDVVGAIITDKWMTQVGFPPDQTKRVCKLIRWHLFRFEDNSSDKAIRKFLFNIGKGTWEDLFLLRIADRAGNLKRADRPRITRKMTELDEKIKGILAEGRPIFEEDIKVDRQDLGAIGLKNISQQEKAISNILGIIYTEPAKNNREWLLKYIGKVYGSNS